MASYLNLDELSFVRRRRLALAAVCCAGGLLAIVLGWVGVSGTRDLADQLSYIASGGVLGLFLLGLGASILITDFVMELERSISRIEARLDAMGTLADPDFSYGEWTESERRLPVAGSAAGPLREGVFLTVPGAKRYHQAGCAMVEGKGAVETVDAVSIDQRGLIPCKVCGANASSETTDALAVPVT